MGEQSVAWALQKLGQWGEGGLVCIGGIEMVNTEGGGGLTGREVTILISGFIKF